MKLYLKQKPDNLKHLVYEVLVATKATFYDKKKEDKQTPAYCNRTKKDLNRVIKTYFPHTKSTTVDKLLKTLKNKDVIGTLFCNYIKKKVIYPINNSLEYNEFNQVLDGTKKLHYDKYNDDYDCY